MRSAQGLTAAVVVLAFVGAAVAGCNSGGEKPAASGADARTESPPTPHTAHAHQAVIEGVRRDFQTTIDFPPGFARCFVSRFSRKLTPDILEELVAIHAAQGEAAAARALNRLGVAVGDSCGGRRWVPQLTTAAIGLRPGVKDG